MKGEFPGKSTTSARSSSSSTPLAQEPEFASGHTVHPQLETEGDTLGVQFFSVFFVHAVTVSAWHICNGWVCHYCATIDNFCLASLQWLNQTKQTKQTKNQKNNKKKTTTKKQNDKTQLSATTSPLGCAILFFFFSFLVLGSLLVV